MTKRQQIILGIILAYMVMAFLWWSLLLNRKITEIFLVKADALSTRLLLEQKINGPEEFKAHPDYLALAERYHRDRLMMAGESAFLGLSILFCLLAGYRNLSREVGAAQQQRNFLLSITHELKSPIASIRLILETFQTRRELPVDIQTKLSTNGLNETDRLTALVNDLLLSARLETSYQLNPEPVDLGSLLEDTADKVAGKYPNTNFILDISPNLPPVIGDRMGLFSIIVNLLENAAKYSQPSPRIEVTAYQGSPLEVIFSVADNGIGIPEEEKRRIWTKFYRVGNEDTRQTKGTGLGLYIVRQLVRLHRGHISLDNNQPRGSRFTVSLPVG